METPKYEFHILTELRRDYQKVAEQLQSEGWELAGNVSIDRDMKSQIVVVIPFKRRI